jgi:hypothetical protein
MYIDPGKPLRDYLVRPCIKIDAGPAGIDRSMAGSSDNGRVSGGLPQNTMLVSQYVSLHSVFIRTPLDHIRKQKRPSFNSA